MCQSERFMIDVLFQDKCLLSRSISITTLIFFFFILMSFVAMLRKVNLSELDLVRVSAVTVCLSPLHCCACPTSALPLGAELCSAARAADQTRSYLKFRVRIQSHM